MKRTSIYFVVIFIQCIATINGDRDDIEISPDEFFAVKNALNFRGKVALVTGSSSGIGAATVRLLSHLGAQVVVHGRNATRVKEVVYDCWKLSPHHLKFHGNVLKPLGIALDLTIPGNVEALLRQTIKTYKKIDILYNNAGIGQLASINDPNFKEIYKAVKAINEDAQVELTNLAAPYIQRTNGSIIFTSSILARMPGPGTGAYSMAKNSLIAFAKTLAYDMGGNVRVNVVSPGIVDGTRIFRLMSPSPRPYMIANSVSSSALHKAAVPMDIAKGIVFLVSPLAGFITGKELQLDAGYRT